MDRNISYRLEDGYLIVSVKGKKDARELELVFLSRSIPFSVQWNPFGRHFHIPESFSGSAQTELDQYLNENQDWPPKPNKEVESFYKFSPVNLPVLAALWWFHWFVRDTGLSRWLEAGRLSKAVINQGELFRTVTALTLHVDSAHLLSNTVGLLVFIAGAGNLVGVGVSWLLVLISAAIGNFVSVLFSNIGYQAIGASTGVFSAVGVLGAFGARRYLRNPELRGRFFVPLIASLGLFAMLGTNPKTDVTAHLAGLLAGVIVGLVFSPLLNNRKLKSRSVQGVALLGFIAGVFFAWWKQWEGMLF